MPDFAPVVKLCLDAQRVATKISLGSAADNQKVVWCAWVPHWRAPGRGSSVILIRSDDIKQTEFTGRPSFAAASTCRKRHLPLTVGVDELAGAPVAARPEAIVVAPAASRVEIPGAFPHRRTGKRVRMLTDCFRCTAGYTYASHLSSGSGEECDRRCSTAGSRKSSHTV